MAWHLKTCTECVGVVGRGQVRGHGNEWQKHESRRLEWEGVGGEEGAGRELQHGVGAMAGTLQGRQVVVLHCAPGLHACCVRSSRPCSLSSHVCRVVATVLHAVMRCAKAVRLHAVIGMALWSELRVLPLTLQSHLLLLPPKAGLLCVATN